MQFTAQLSNNAAHFFFDKDMCDFTPKKARHYH